MAVLEIYISNSTGIELTLLMPVLLWLRPGRLVILRYLVRLVSGGRFPPESTYPPTGYEPSARTAL